MSSIKPVTIVIDNGEPMQGEYNASCEWIDVTSDRAVRPDPSWSFVDGRGHYHAWAQPADSSRNLPTLKAESVEMPCDGSCGGVCGGEGYVRTEYHCGLCGEVVEPRTVPDRGTKTIPGLETHEVVVYGEVAGERVSVLVHLGDRTMFGFGQVVSTDVVGSLAGWRSVRTRLICGPMVRQLDRPKVGAR